MSGGEVEITSSTLNTDLIADCSSTRHPGNISSVVRPYQPIMTDEESDLNDDCVSVIDDADEHRVVKPPLGNVYKYVSHRNSKFVYNNYIE